MKVYRVVYEYDGETTSEPGKRATEIKRMEVRYAADHINEVWDAIEYMRNDEEKIIIAIIEESPAIIILGSNGGIQESARSDDPAGMEG